MNSRQLIIEANPYQQEELIALLSDFDPLGFEERDTELIAWFSDGQFDKEILHVLEGYAFHQATVEDKNWNEEWERNFHPVRVGNFAAMRADFHNAIDDVQYEIIITPKMSFGTGHHATTYMMMAQMEHIDFTGKTVFDFGTGTGILAILAEKLGAALIDAIDVDEWSIDNAQENVQRNQCHQINITQSTVIPDKQYDIILANINRNVILEYMDGLRKATVPNGYILFSGLLTADRNDIIAAAATAGFKLVKEMESTNWISLLFTFD